MLAVKSLPVKLLISNESCLPVNAKDLSIFAVKHLASAISFLPYQCEFQKQFLTAHVIVVSQAIAYLILRDMLIQKIAKRFQISFVQCHWIDLGELRLV